MSASFIQIEKLDETNYDCWAFQMKSVLIQNGFWKIVSGENVKTEQNKEKWESDDEKALASICLAIKPSQVGYIKSCKSSNEAWKKLEDVYMPKSPLQMVSLYRSLANHKMADGGDVVNHLNEFSKLTDKLAEIGMQIQEELLTVILLSSLPKSYESFIIAVGTRDDLPKLAFLKQRILEESKRRTGEVSNVTVNSMNNQAFAIKSNKYNKNPNGNKKQRQFQGQCFVCGMSGHYANKCKKRINGNSNSNGSGGNINSNNRRINSTAILSVTESNSLNNCKWYVDSGATSHMCNNRSLFVELKEHEESIALAGNKNIKAVGIGDIFFENENILLKDVLYSPELKASFISVSKMVDKGVSVNFNCENAVIQKTNGSVIFKAVRSENLFVAKFNNVVETVYAAAANPETVLWHNRFGHLNYQSLYELSNKEVVKGFKIGTKDKIEKCRTCMVSKIHCLPFPKESASKSKDLLELVHADVCGPFRVPSLGGSRYFVTFIDDKSRRIFVYFLKYKSEVFDKFMIFKNQAERQTGKKIKSLRTDNGTEFINNSFNSLLEAEGIIRQLSTPYTPQQNGVAERANRTLVEMARSMMVHARVEEYLWAEAINTAVYLRNRCTTKQIKDKTPYEVWNGRKPNVQHLRTFGSYAVGLDKSANRSKFEAKGTQCILVGYSNNAKAYRLFDLETHAVIEQRDVIFDEDSVQNVADEGSQQQHSFFDQEILNSKDEGCKNEKENFIFIFENNQSNNEKVLIDDGETFLEDMETIAEHDDFTTADEVSDESDDVGPGRPKKILTGKPGRPKKQYCKKVATNMLNVAMNEVIPESYEDVFLSPNKSLWEKAMTDEFTALQKNKTWYLTELPKGKKAIPCRWVYNIKRKSNGEIERYKARLVAKGCNQIYGENYFETFSPVARYSTIRLLLALAVKNKMHLHQIDVTTAYLNSELEDEVYMKPPPNFVDKDCPNKVLKLNKAIYGLKQSGKEWHKRLDDTLRKMDFSPCKNEPCLYKSIKDDKLVLIAVYVDDLIIGCIDKNIVIEVKNELNEEFEINDKGILNHFLGMEVEREGETGKIKLSQYQYIKKVLKQYGMEKCKSVATPLDPGCQVNCNDDCERVDQQEYQSLVGVLMYLAISTRPDILHSVSKMAQRNTDPHVEHMTMLKRILRYLAGTINYKIIYESNDSKALEGFVDADWAGDAVDRKSYTGFSFFVSDCLVSWESRKQNSVALSSTEAEYMAASEAAKEAIYLKRILMEIESTQDEPVVLNIDNQGAMMLAENPVHHKRSKHIDIKYHHLRELVEKQEILLNYCPSGDMISDIFTKNLAKEKHVKFVHMIKLNSN